MSLVARVKAILLTPRTEWPVIEGEPATVASLYTGYIIPLAAIPAVASFIGLSLVLIFQPYFPRRLVLDFESIAVVFIVTVVMCLAASTLGIRLALKVDPAEALASSG